VYFVSNARESSAPLAASTRSPGRCRRSFAMKTATAAVLRSATVSSLPGMGLMKI
jgi:hypothetical protein